jgi:8-oxo-dGTP diphosphatase
VGRYFFGFWDNGHQPQYGSERLDMAIGRFYAGVGALLWSPVNERYLLLKRADDKDFAGGAWECVTGRVDQGESFEEAVHREVLEELGVAVQLEFIVGTTHFYRGEERPEDELVGVFYCGAIEDPTAIQVSPEHSDYRWVTAEEAYGMFDRLGPGNQWIRRLIERAEAIKALLPPELLALYREHGFELG